MSVRTHTIERGRIEEHIVPGKRLGRHYAWDSRSLAYTHRNSGVTLQSVLHERHIPILNQGDVGACTGNAETGALGCDPLYGPLASRPGGVVLTEQTALALYSAAETIDGDGPYPPNDNGSCGLSVCKAALNEDLISGYTHCLSQADVLDALQTSPVILGVNWYDSFDTPDSSGLISISPGAQVRGGHEILARGIDVDARTVFLDNSWGTDWGVSGSFTMSWATLEQLLAEQGDGTVSIALGSPVPAPAAPTPAAPDHPHDLIRELLDDARAFIAKGEAWLAAHTIRDEPAPAPQPAPGAAYAITDPNQLLADVGRLAREISADGDRSVSELVAFLHSFGI